MNRPKRQLSPNDVRVRRWVKKNPGVVDRIALRCHVSKAAVSLVAYGRSVSTRVERELYSHGWPGTPEAGARRARMIPIGGLNASQV